MNFYLRRIFVLVVWSSEIWHQFRIICSPISPLCSSIACRYQIIQEVSMHFYCLGIVLNLSNTSKRYICIVFRFRVFSVVIKCLQTTDFVLCADLFKRSMLHSYIFIIAALIVYARRLFVITRNQPYTLKIQFYRSTNWKQLLRYASNVQTDVLQ